MAAGAQQGRDKLTLLLPPRLASFGLWVEQLVAESTGKQGDGVVPIAGEAAGGAVRVATACSSRSRSATTRPTRPRSCAGPGVGRADRRVAHAVATRARRRVLPLGGRDRGRGRAARDQPVRRAERAAGQGRHAGPARHLPHAAAPARAGGARAVDGCAVHAQPHRRWSRPAAIRCRHVFSAARPPDYVAVLAYLPPDTSPSTPRCATCGAALAARTGCATMFGYGPRYLHSTGQLHKGGPNTGVFVVITAEPQADLPMPGRAVLVRGARDGAGARRLPVARPDRPPRGARAPAAPRSAAAEARRRPAVGR